MDASNNRKGIRVRRLRLAGSTASGRAYNVSFLDDQKESFRPLSIIAGPSQTGKTSVTDFIQYCLGGKEYPQHPEIVANVRSAILEAVLDDEVTTIERTAVGGASKFASLWVSPIESVRNSSELRVSVEPPSDPGSLSQFYLATCGLDNIALPEAPTQQESASQLLSIRDMFRLMFLPNERLDNKNLVLEHAVAMVRQKMYQTIDVMFDVHDEIGADIASRAKSAAAAAREAQRHADSLREIVQREHPLGPLVLETEQDQAKTEVRSLSQQIQNFDQNQLSHEGAITELRRNLEDVQQAAKEAALRVRNRQSLMDRLSALRGQYADDKKKLAFLKEAEKLFDPLQVQTCPACLSSLSTPPVVDDGVCSLCGHDVHSSQDGESLLGDARQSGNPDDLNSAARGEAAVLAAEYRETSRRLDELNDYWSRLDADLRILKNAQSEADAAVDGAASALDRVSNLPAPYLAGRDDLSRRYSAALLREQQAAAGLRLWAQVKAAESKAEMLVGQAALLRGERKDRSSRPDRTAVIRKLSERFGEILSAIGYPKLSEPYLNERLIPHVRGLVYTAASSGGLVLISLAWYLALWEVAYEEGARAPGLLVIDSPQKNLGHSAKVNDPDFADTRLVENFYNHARQWLAGPGQGAQLIVVDNSPPEAVSNDVVVRYTRDRDISPYGLIEDAID